MICANLSCSVWLSSLFSSSFIFCYCQWILMSIFVLCVHFSASRIVFWCLHQHVSSANGIYSQTCTIFTTFYIFLFLNNFIYLLLHFRLWIYLCHQLDQPCLLCTTIMLMLLLCQQSVYMTKQQAASCLGVCLCVLGHMDWASWVVHTLHFGCLLRFLSLEQFKSKLYTAFPFLVFF